MAVAYSYSTPQINVYKTQSVMGLTPGELVVKTYDLILSSLAAHDEARACKALALLIDSLDFEYQDVSTGLLRLYKYCMEEIKKGQFETPSLLIRELRNSWEKALEQLERVSS